MNTATTAIGQFPAHMDAAETRICNLLITVILEAGYAIRVRCGEEGDVFVEATTDRAAIQKETAATGATYYDVMSYNAHPGKMVRVGTIWLVHGNGCDLISDTSWPENAPENEAIIEAVCKPAQQLANTF